jgi:hypothetical protein
LHQIALIASFEPRKFLLVVQIELIIFEILHDLIEPFRWTDTLAVAIFLVTSLTVAVLGGIVSVSVIDDFGLLVQCGTLTTHDVASQGNLGKMPMSP